MKKLNILILLLLIPACISSNKVYWCGDHPCINKKEREAYFKETMIVEVKNKKYKKNKNNTVVEKILKDAKLKQNKRIQNEKNLSKLEKKREKELKKKAKIDEKKRKKDEKQRKKEEKKLAKQIKKDEKTLVKKEKKSINFTKKKQINAFDNKNVQLSKFDDLVEKIKKKNILRSYPDINNIPN